MQYAVSNWIYGDEPLRETFERLTRFGYDGIELVGEPARYEVSTVRTLCSEFGIEVTSVLSWCLAGIPGRDAATPDEAERDRAQDYVQACIDLAADVGAPTVIVIPAPAGRTAPVGAPDTEEAWHAGYEAEWNNAVQSVRTAVAYAGERNISIALEPINRYESFLVTDVETALLFRKDVGDERLRLHLDTFHMNIEEADLPAAIRAASDVVASLHVADSNREAPGRGHIDFGALFDALADVGFDGPLIVEPVPPGSDPLLAIQRSENQHLRDVYAEESIRYLKRMIGARSDEQ